MLYTTLNEIRKHSPCKSGWETLLNHLSKTKADDEQIAFTAILEAVGVQDTLWCLRVLPKDMLNNIKLLVCDLAEEVLQYVPEGEDRPRKVIQASRDYIAGNITKDELLKARRAADAAYAAYADDAAAYAADAADAAAADAADAAYAAADADDAAAYAADAAAADAYAAYAADAAYADDAAYAAAYAAAYDAARKKAKERQAEIMTDWFNTF